MSAPLANISRLKPEIRLAQAVSQFEADLSSEQKTTFRTSRSRSRDSPPNPSDVMRLTAEIDRQGSGGVGGRQCFGPRFTNFLQAVQQFAAIGDIVVGGSQNIIACGVWALVRMSLLSIVSFSSYLDKLSTLLMTVGCSAPRYQMMALLYSQSTNIQSYLSEYFIVVVRLCHQVLKFTMKSTIGRFAFTLNDSDIKTYQSELDRWANTIKEEANLLMAKKIDEEAQENFRFRALSSKYFKSASLRRKMKTNLRVLDFCSMYDYETTWKQTRKVGSATLFNQNAEYQDWKGRANSCTLIYTGKLGSGKSVLLANIVDDINLHVQSKNHVVAYFFCRHDIPQSLKARTIYGSLARQLLRPIPDLTMMAEILGGTTSALDFERIFALLQRALPPGHKAYFILDGLDGCGYAEREMLIQQLRKLQKTFTLFLCASTRLDPGGALILSSEQFIATRIASIPDKNPDIGTFIEAELANCIESKRLVIGDPGLILKIQDALLEGSQGMFLWVALQIKSLCLMKTDDATLQALADLPKDLSETFSHILLRSEASGKPYQRRILELVTAAHRPLTIEELREALSVVPGDIVWNPARLLNDIFSTLTCCGSLLIVDEEELTVRLVHHSVKQFLFSGFKDSNNIAYTIDSAKREMADIIITYLSYGVFGTQLSTMVIPQISAGSAPFRIIRSTLESSSSVRNLTLKLLKSRKWPNCDIGPILAETSKLFNSRSVDKFHFFSYAKSYWLQHILCTSDQEPSMYDLLLRLFQGNIVDSFPSFGSLGLTPQKSNPAIPTHYRLIDNPNPTEKSASQYREVATPSANITSKPPVPNSEDSPRRSIALGWLQGRTEVAPIQSIEPDIFRTPERTAGDKYHVQWVEEPEASENEVEIHNPGDPGAADEPVKGFKHIRIRKPGPINLSHLPSRVRVFRGIHPGVHEYLLRVHNAELIPAYAFADDNPATNSFYIRERGIKTRFVYQLASGKTEMSGLVEFFGLQAILIGAFFESQYRIISAAYETETSRIEHVSCTRMQIWTESAPELPFTPGFWSPSPASIPTISSSLGQRNTIAGVDFNDVPATKILIYVLNGILVLIVSDRIELRVVKRSFGAPQPRPSVDIVPKHWVSLRVRTIRGSSADPPGIPLDQAGMHFSNQKDEESFRYYKWLRIELISEEADENIVVCAAFRDDFNSHVLDWKKRLKKFHEGQREPLVSAKSRGL
ncbi:MAG: hypothetical protein M1840_004642 [Geoglossum simile]|nr:MAG: hypothetical protein M1840_004642 [Geoglossum simile]